MRFFVAAILVFGFVHFFGTSFVDAQTQYGVKYNGGIGKNEIYSIDADGNGTLLKQFAFDSGAWQPASSYADLETGVLYMLDSTDGTYVTYDPKTNTLTKDVKGGYVSGYQKLFPHFTPTTDVIENTTIGSDSVTKIKTKNLVDSAGTTLIKTTSDGATHIGENSLVTQEVNGVQELYATNSSGNQIDINIKSGTNLLIDGTNVMTHIANSTALSSSLTSLPTTSTGEALYTCGLGMGYSAGSTAFAGGCALKLGDLGFADDWSNVWKNASFNLGGSTVVSGKSESSIKMGLTFNFGSKGQQKSTITTASLETDTKMFAFNQKTERQEEKIYKLESELDDMKKQVASASKLRGEVNTLKRELASAKREINSYKVLNARLDKLEKLLSIQIASLN